MEYVQTYVETKWPDESHEERQQAERELKLWDASEKREHTEVMEAAERIIEIKPEIELKFKLDDTLIKGPLAAFGNKIHIAFLNGRYESFWKGIRSSLTRDSLLLRCCSLNRLKWLLFCCHKKGYPQP
uniref:DUF3898 domain-containing protein n=1 Tax=Paenibacillus sp. FSL K6-0276 TaxID=2921450 RepID=UPI00403FB070